MKAYTDIEQSKKLAEILPIESADMFLALNGTQPVMSKYIDDGFVTADNTAIPCWSLAALLDQLEDVICDEEDNQWELVIEKEGVQYDLYYLIVYGEQENIELDRFYDDLIDCCFQIIFKLKEKDLL